MFIYLTMIMLSIRLTIRNVKAITAGFTSAGTQGIRLTIRNVK